MRILIVTEFQPATEEAEITGGVEAYCYYVAREMRARGHHVEVVARRSPGTEWQSASLASIPSRVAFLLKASLAVMREKTDVMVATTYVVAPLVWVAGLVRRKPAVMWWADVLIGTWKDGGFGRVEGLIGESVEKALVRLPRSNFIAISESTAGKLRKQGVAASRISVIPCGYEPGVIVSVLESRRPTVPHRLITVSRLVPYKRVDVVIRALALLRQRQVDASLLIVGQGPERERLQALAVELGVSDATEFSGHLASHADVLHAVAESSVFVSASEIEGFGIAVVEAMALGTPYCISDIPAHREVTGGGVGGMLVNRGDVEAFAGGIRRLLDVETKADLSAEARQFAKRYTWGSVAEATLQQFSSISRARGASTLV